MDASKTASATYVAEAAKQTYVAVLSDVYLHAEPEPALSAAQLCLLGVVVRGVRLIGESGAVLAEQRWHNKAVAKIILPENAIDLKNASVCN